MLGMARPRARFLQTYGQTETGPVTIRVHRLGRRSGHDGRCVGRPLVGHTKVRVETADGRRAGRGASGPVLAWSSGVTPTYLGTGNASADGWWRMGDHATITRRGCLHLHDRLVDQVPGIDSLLAVEDTILDRLPVLTEVALIGVPDGPPVPLVCTRDDVPLDPAAWREATDGLPELAPPLQCRWDDVPHTATWKVRRAEAARRLAADALPVITWRP
jgi:acyl-coenzyme A synthetase/AMP-(fatty) acid ligase